MNRRFVYGSRVLTIRPRGAARPAESPYVVLPIFKGTIGPLSTGIGPEDPGTLSRGRSETDDHTRCGELKQVRRLMGKVVIWMSGVLLNLAGMIAGVVLFIVAMMFVITWVLLGAGRILPG
jgi:hypothetical protein